MSALVGGIEQTERDKYEKMWALPQYRTSSPDEAYLPTLRKWLPHRCSINVYGCGPGRAGLLLARAGHLVTMIDIADNCLDPAVEQIVTQNDVLGRRLHFVRGSLTAAARLMPPAEWGICCDVLEHLPPEWVPACLEQMRRLTPKIFLSISHVPDVCGRWIQDTLHLTVAPLEWWMPHLARLWPKMSIGTAGGSVSTLFCEAGNA